MTPTAPYRPCAAPGCPTLVPKGRCERHRQQQEQRRGTPAQRGYGADHARMRKQVLAEEPTCRRCGADGQPSDHADHIVPRSRGGTNDRENYQRLCSRCNARKARAQS